MNQPSLIGQTIDNGRYEIMRLIGEGGMGRVFEARQIKVNRLVAIKVLHSHWARDPRLVERFKREALTASQFRHPNTVMMHDYGTTEDGDLFIVMELLKGQSLLSLIEKEGKLSCERAFHIMEQVCGAIIEVHRANVVHRDIKPDNIQVDPREGHPDFVKILDFSIAKLVSDNSIADAKASLTLQGAVFGTPHYMSPEQVRGKPLDQKTDIYAMGVILYQMISGEVPYNEESPQAVMMAHLTSPVPDLKQNFPKLNIPLEVSELIKDCMQKDPKLRIQTSEILLQKIRDIQLKLEIEKKNREKSTPVFKTKETVMDLSRIDAGLSDHLTPLPTDQDHQAPPTDPSVISVDSKFLPATSVSTEDALLPATAIIQNVEMQASSSAEPTIPNPVVQQNTEQNLNTGFDEKETLNALDTSNVAEESAADKETIILRNHRLDELKNYAPEALRSKSEDHAENHQKDLIEDSKITNMATNVESNHQIELPKTTPLFSYEDVHEIRSIYQEEAAKVEAATAQVFNEAQTFKLDEPVSSSKLLNQAFAENQTPIILEAHEAQNPQASQSKSSAKNQASLIQQPTGVFEQIEPQKKNNLMWVIASIVIALISAFVFFLIQDQNQKKPEVISFSHPITIRIDSLPAESEIWIKDKMIAKTPYDFTFKSVAEIDSVIILKSEGYQDRLVQLPKSNQNLSKVYELSAKAKIEIESVPQGAIVFANQKELGKTPLMYELILPKDKEKKMINLELQLAGEKIETQVQLKPMLEGIEKVLVDFNQLKKSKNLPIKKDDSKKEEINQKNDNKQLDPKKIEPKQVDLKSSDLKKNDPKEAKQTETKTETKTESKQNTPKQQVPELQPTPEKNIKKVPDLEEELEKH